MNPSLTSRMVSSLKTRHVLISAAAVALCTLGAQAQDSEPEGGTGFGLWEPFAPPENPPNADRQVLGKMLFWDEQLSSDSTTACGTCHITSEGGLDPRIGINPAFDGIFGTPDDVDGSPGIIETDVNGEYLRSDFYDLSVQVTPRRSMTNFVAMYAGNLFWDGRAEGNFVDPVTGETLAISSAGLEIQALGPIMSTIEMAHNERDWSEVIDKLTNAKPMALASNLTPDIINALAVNETYPDLFEQAFGDPEITAGRIGFAIANYERSLVPNQSPWDLWNAGDSSAMTPDQIAGHDIFRNSACITCHLGPLFSQMSFVTEGVRPVAEDRGRQIVTGVFQERGAFKMPTLRNVGLRDRFMHTGKLTTLDDVFDFYAHRNGQAPFTENLDFRLTSPIVFSPSDEALVKEFINNGLTDPRIANETFPFDRPTLHSELPTENPLVIESGSAGSGGFVPQMIALVPPNIGNLEFKVGLDFALGGAQAWVAVSSSPPTKGIVAQDELLGPITLNGMGDGDGFGTMFYPIDDTSLDGQTLYMQWVIADPNATDGFARSAVAQIMPFCSMTTSCAIACPADLNDDGTLDFFDVSAFLTAFTTADPAADFNGDGNFNFFDVSAFLNSFAAGCP
ncbi:MAG: cytochrome c peroxidase [Phycisphaerales bacterium]